MHLSNGMYSYSLSLSPSLRLSLNSWGQTNVSFNQLRLYDAFVQSINPMPRRCCQHEWHLPSIWAILWKLICSWCLIGLHFRHTWRIEPTRSSKYCTRPPKNKVPVTVRACFPLKMTGKCFIHLKARQMTHGESVNILLQVALFTARSGPKSLPS